MKRVARLISQFKPDQYILDLIPNREQKKFSGSVEIIGRKVGRPSKRITFHQNKLSIQSASIVRHGKHGNETVTVARINTHKTLNEVRLHTTEMLYPGNYTVRLEFSGSITDNMDGIYPCTFTHDGTEKQLIATQFESHHARDVFPCIDEPAAKATFQLSLTTPANEAVISNTPIQSQKPAATSKLVHTTFETTPVMSTYLLAFVYGELGYKEAKTKRGVTVRTYATPDNVDFTSFALETAVRCLDYYSEYFDIDYPLAKCDMVALPDFASGAMENWGCVTYREQAMFVDPENTSVGMKQYVAMVVAHELTHQWFGNLVTMEWWTDLWLNEGFASWFEYLALDHLFPEWQMWTQFIVDDQLMALKSDALEHTHPIEVEVKHPDEIRTIFDNISYHKGASVIHMLYNYLGAKDFQTGLRHYLRKFSYKNTKTTDLWDAFAEASGKSVVDFMHAWTAQSGYPLLKVDISDKTISLHQQRFVLNPASTSTEGLWPIPLLPNKSLDVEMLTQQELIIPSKSDHASLMFNAGSSGFYCTAYNSEHMQSLVQLLKNGKLSVLDRLSLLSDSMEVAKAGHGSTANALNLLAAYAAESDNAVWDIIATSLASIRAVMHDDQIREDMKPFVRQLVAGELARLGWQSSEHDSHFDSLLRPTIIAMAASADEPNVLKEAKKRFAVVAESFKKDGKPTHTTEPDLRGVVYTTIARKGGTAEFETLVQLHAATNSTEEKLSLTAALCSFEQPELITKALDMIKTKAVRSQDVAYWISYSLSNRFSRIQTWQWIQANWQWLENTLGTDLAFFRMPVYVARNFSDKTFLKEFTSFFGKVLSPAFERSYNQGIEMITWQSAWRERDLYEVRTFFKKYV